MGTQRDRIVYDEDGRITALVADGDEPCHDCQGEDHFGTTGGSVTDKPWDGAASRFNDDQYQNATAACDPKTGADSGETVKQRCFLPHHEPDGTVNSNGVHAAAQRASSLKGHDPKAVETAKAHLRSHYAKDLKEDAPKSIGGDAAVEPTIVLAGTEHDPLTGTHAHEHSTFGDQGGDERHAHEHNHDGDASHAHTHGASAMQVDTEPGPDGEPGGCGCSADGCTSDAMEPTNDDGTCGCTCAACVSAGSHFSAKVMSTVRRHRHATLNRPIDPSAPISSSGLVTLTQQPATTFDAGTGIPQIVSDPGGAWHAYLHVEGIRTDDGREIAAGATQFPDLPVSLRFLEKDEGGHYGAVSCGLIKTMEMQEVNGVTVCYATGNFGSDEAGQRAQLAVEEQTQRFVSIDPRDVEGEYIEVQVSTSGSGILDILDGPDNCDYDGWFRMTSFVVGAATIVPIPALQQAVITMASEELPWAPISIERAAPSIQISASGAPRTWADHPPLEWFETPPPVVGDSRLVRQPDGKHAIPLTVTDDGRVYGHACYWGQEHTGFPGRKVTPERSATYAYFQTGERVVLDGDAETRIPVGKITMGTGHPSIHMGATAAKAHYDGGYGAVQVADVRAVEDDFGVWLSGSLCLGRSERNPDGPTPEQIAQFMSLDISPDWRKVAGKLHMIALLAVPVGGFPIARESLVASGLSAFSEEEVAGVPRAAYEGDEIVAMVAAGRVHRMPLGQRVHQLETVVDELRADLQSRRRSEARAALASLVE
jgi:hypothetical protein